MTDHRATLTKLYSLIYTEVDKLEAKQSENEDTTLSSVDRDSLIEYLKVLRSEKDQQDKSLDLSKMTPEELDKRIAEELANNPNLKKDLK